jgi:hypothetical protein
MVEYDRLKERERWKALFESAQDELVDALQERERLETRIRSLQEDIGHLAALCGEPVEDPLKELGLTDAIRYVFGKAKPQALNAVGVKNGLVADGYDISEYSNVMASIHTVIKRLLKKKEIESGAAGFEGKTYVWAGGLPPPPPLPERLRKRVKPA